MDDDIFEDIKEWWEKNRTMLITGISAVAIFGSGWLYWQSYQQNTQFEAAQIYAEFYPSLSPEFDSAQISSTANLPLTQVGISEETRTSAKILAQKLKSEYSSTGYAPLAALFLARDMITNNDINGAVEEFKWVIENSSTEFIRNIARLRLARTQVALDKHEEALQTLNKVEGATTTGRTKKQPFSAAVNDLRGDIYTLMQDTEKARIAYQDSLNADPDSYREFLLKIKLAALPTPLLTSTQQMDKDEEGVPDIAPEVVPETSDITLPPTDTSNNTNSKQ